MSDLQSINSNVNEIFQYLQTNIMINQKQSQQQLKSNIFNHQDSILNQNNKNYSLHNNNNKNHNKKKENSQKVQKDDEEQKVEQKIIKNNNEQEQNDELYDIIGNNISSLFHKISSFNEQIMSELQENKLNIINMEQQQKQLKNEQILSNYEANSQKMTEQFQQNEIILHQEQQRITMKQFQTGNNIGQGKFGQILQIKYKKIGQIYTLKKILKSTIQQYCMYEQFYTQLKIINRLQHPNIVESYYAFTDQYHYFIVMQYIDGINLVQMLQMNAKNNIKLSEIKISMMIKQILLAVQFMHKQKIIHRDIKLENVMLSNEVIKICDFGWALLQQEYSNVFCGTLDYVCPEMVNKISYSYKVDLWSIGALTYELIYGKAPFKAETKQQTFQNIKNLIIQWPQSIQITSQCKSFIEGYLKPQSDRKSIQWGLNHSFIKISSQQTGKIPIQDVQKIQAILNN